MKTIVIWNEGFEKPLRFFVLEGDKSKYNGIFVNGYYNETEKDNLADELADLVYNRNGDYVIQMLDSFPVTVITDSMTDDSGPVVVIEAGFIP